MKRKLFMTDIHGNYEGMRQLLQVAKFDPLVDQLIIGGDMIDRGEDSGLVVKDVYQMCEQYPHNVKAVIGNHERMADWYLNSRSYMWLNHGGLETINSFNKVFKTEKERELHLNWLFSLPLVIEDEDFVYTHAGLFPYDGLYEQDPEILWMEESEFYSYPREDLLAGTKGKPVIHGHTPCENVLFDGARLNGDLGSKTYPIKDERGLALINLSDMTYLVYKDASKEIFHKNILTLS